MLRILVLAELIGNQHFCEKASSKSEKMKLPIFIFTTQYIQAAPNAEMPTSSNIKL